MISEKPANGFDTRVKVDLPDRALHIEAWARFTEGSDLVEYIKIRRDGDFGAIINKTSRSRVIIPFREVTS